MCRMENGMKIAAGLSKRELRDRALYIMMSE